MKHRKTQSGYTMIESIAFLGIVIMLGVSVLTLISRMIDKYKISRIGQQVIELQKAVDLRYSASPNYADISVSDLLKEKLAPSDMVANKKLYHSFAGPVNVKSGAYGYTYLITFSKLPQQPCVELAMLGWSDKYTAHLLSVKINSAKFSWTGTPSRRLPIDIAIAQKQCKDNDNNTIVWQFQ